MKSQSAWFENGTEKARKLKKENSKRLIKSAILGNADIIHQIVHKQHFLVNICIFMRLKNGIFR